MDVAAALVGKVRDRQFGGQEIRTDFGTQFIDLGCAPPAGPCARLAPVRQLMKEGVVKTSRTTSATLEVLLAANLHVVAICAWEMVLGNSLIGEADVRPGVGDDPVHQGVICESGRSSETRGRCARAPSGLSER
jgi:hypothetical protein